jgi:hypothetical protein
MGWRGTMRSIVAASRAAERDAQRRRKQNLKAQMVAESASALEDWQNYIHDLVSIHTDMADMIDWHGLASRPKPPEPSLRHTQQEKAERALAAFKPSIFHFVRGGSEKLRARLQDAVKVATAKDQKQFDDDTAAYAKALAEWNDDTALAKRLVRGEAAAIRQVIEEMQSALDTTLVGSEIAFSIGDNYLHARPNVHGEDIVPSTRRKQLASGRLSESKMPVGEFNELYQDYVASAALKVAGDLFHILPLEEIYVTCTASLLNAQTGHKENTPVLSIQFVRETFMALNLAGIDPSDAMRNFRHAMKFSRTKGFAAIEPLQPVGA